MDRFFQIAEDATPKPILSQVAKEAFHQVEPGRAGGSEVQMKARMPREPGLHFVMFMVGIVIADQVQLPVGGDGLVDEVEKLEPLLVAMPLLAPAKDLAVGGIQSGEQGGRAVVFVVVRHGGPASALQRQAGLSTVQSLNLVFLVGAQHQRVLWRIEVRAGDVFQFSANAGSLLILKVSTRCGFNPWARQMRRTLASLIPTAAAMVRVLQ
jgi:hypothetical protein